MRRLQKELGQVSGWALTFATSLKVSWMAGARFILEAFDGKWWLERHPASGSILCKRAGKTYSLALSYS